MPSLQIQPRCDQEGAKNGGEKKPPGEQKVKRQRGNGVAFSRGNGCLFALATKGNTEMKSLVADLRGESSNGTHKSPAKAFKHFEPRFEALGISIKQSTFRKPHHWAAMVAGTFPWATGWAEEQEQKRKVKAEASDAAAAHEHSSMSKKGCTVSPSLGIASFFWQSSQFPPHGLVLARLVP
jgi:hypothetical protein